MIKNIFSQYYAKIITAPISLFIHSLIVRNLTVGDYASYAFITAIIMVMLNLSDLGVGNYYYREMLIRKSDYLKSIIKKRSVIYMLVGIVFLFLIHFELLSELKGNIYYILIILGTVYLMIVSGAFELAIRALSLFPVIAKINIASVVINLCLYLIFFFVYHLNIYTVLLILFISNLIRVLIDNFFYRKNRIKFLKSQELKFKPKNYLPWFLVYLCGIIALRLDVFMLEKISDAYNLAIYSASYGIYEKLEFFVLSITSVVYNYFSDHNDEKSFSILFNMIIFVSFLFLLGIIIFSKPLVSLIIGSKYPEANKIFYIMGIGTYFRYFTSFFISYLLIKKKEWVYVYGALSFILMNFFLNYLLIPRYGAVGAMYATFASDFIYLIVVLYFFTLYTKNKLSFYYYPSLILVVSFIFLPKYISLVIDLLLCTSIFYRIYSNKNVYLSVLRGEK